LALCEQNELQRQVNERLKTGLIIPSNSAYASQAFLINKADKTKRLIIDGIYICILILGYIIIHIIIKKLIWCYVGETNKEIMNSQRIRGRDRIV